MQLICDNVAVQGGVFIHEIHAGGAAEKTDALHHGDLVTKVERITKMGNYDVDHFLVRSMKLTSRASPTRMPWPPSEPPTR